MPGCKVLDWYICCIVMFICFRVIVIMKNMTFRGNCYVFGRVAIRFLLRRENSSIKEGR